MAEIKPYRDSIPGFRKPAGISFAPKPANVTPHAGGVTKNRGQATENRRPRNYGAALGMLGGGGVGIGALTGILGSRLLGEARGQSDEVPETTSDRVSFANSAFGKQIGKPVDTTVPRSLRAPVQEPVDDTQYSGNLQAFIDQARSMLSGQQSSAESLLSGQESAVRGAAGSAQSQIDKGYAALSSFIGGTQAGNINQAYQGGMANTGAAGNEAAQQIQSANAAASAQQQAIMSRLGIQDANIAIQNTGTTQAEDMQNALTESAQQTQLAQNQLGTNQQTELGYNNAMGTSAQLEGQGQRNRINQDLTSRLADIASQRTQVQSAGQDDVLGLAQQLMSNDRENFEGNYDRRYRAQNDAMQFAQQMAESSQPQAAPELNSTSYRALGPLGQANYALTQSGVDPGQSAIITRAIEQAYATGNIRSAADFAKVVRQASGVSPQNQIDAANAAAIYFQYFQ